MAISLDRKRKADAENTARRAGFRIEQPNLTVNDQNLLGNGNQSDIFVLPTDTGDWMPLQVIDQTSPDLGKPYFMPSIDIPGNPNRVVR